MSVRLQDTLTFPIPYAFQTYKPSRMPPKFVICRGSAQTSDGDTAEYCWRENELLAAKFMRTSLVRGKFSRFEPRSLRLCFTRGYASQPTWLGKPSLTAAKPHKASFWSHTIPQAKGTAVLSIIWFVTGDQNSFSWVWTKHCLNRYVILSPPLESERSLAGILGLGYTDILLTDLWS